jgi:hypothetical protein
VLYKVGATEVKGFALTMSIGVITTLFTGIWVTRAIFEMMLACGLSQDANASNGACQRSSARCLPQVDWIALPSGAPWFQRPCSRSISVVVVLRARQRHLRDRVPRRRHR